MENSYFKTERKERAELLKDFNIRWEHFINRKHDSGEELEIIFFKDTLYFSADAVTEQDAQKYSDLIATIVKQKHFDGKRQDARFDALKSRFGEDGITTGVEIWHAVKNAK